MTETEIVKKDLEEIYIGNLNTVDGSETAFKGEKRLFFSMGVKGDSLYQP